MGSEFLLIMYLNKHIPNKKVVPRQLVDHPERNSMFRVGSGIAILHEQLPPLEVGQEPGP